MGGRTKRGVDAVKKKKARRNTGCTTVMEGGQEPDPGGFGDIGSKDWSARSWESVKHRSWGIPVEGFRQHVAFDGSVLGVLGRKRARGWSVAQLDHDDDMGPRHGMYGTSDAELEVQRTIKTSELTAFLCHFSGIFGSSTARVDNKGFIDGLWRGEMKCSGS